MKSRKTLFALLMSLIFVFGAVTAVACTGGKTEIPEGEETGIYCCYYEGEEYLLTLYGGDKFMLLIRNKSERGEYSIEEGKIKLTLSDEETISATLKDKTISLKYDGKSLLFRLKEYFNVRFDSKGGSEVSAVEVVSGLTVGRPADPVREGYIFLGWYTDTDFVTPFIFDSEIIAEDTTLYAKWERKNQSLKEFEISFDLNYEDAPELSARLTQNSKLFNLSDPAREGYRFLGWWVSMYEDAKKLSYKYSPDLMFEENTTLYALWEDESVRLSAPLVEVGPNVISWNNVGSASNYTITITAPDGTNIVDNETSSNLQYNKIKFANLPQGDYIVSVTANANATTKSPEAVRYYRNKGLNRVSVFSVTQSSVLVFNDVPHAEKYYISVKCGNPDHEHENVDLGKETKYDFSNCDMKGGVIFKVTAVANGYASSESKEFVYNRTLSAISGFYLDQATETLMWEGVEGATDYVVSISCAGEHDHGDISNRIHNGNKTSISLKECVPVDGKIEVSVYPRSKGYASPEPSAYTYTANRLAVPRNIRTEGSDLTFDAVDGASKYFLTINGVFIDNEFTNRKINLAGIARQNDLVSDVYYVSLQASGNGSSLWSDEVRIDTSDISSVVYSRNTVSWDYVLGAVSYEVSVNGIVVDSAVTNNKLEIELNSAGENIISVRSYNGTTYSQSISTSVYAYTVTFDANGGEGGSVEFRATGDKLNPPVVANDRHAFNGWYNTPGGAEKNGSKYSNDLFEETSDLILYAAWAGAINTVTYDYGADNSDLNPIKSIDVQFGKNYQMIVPEPKSKEYVFLGWSSVEGDVNTLLTDQKGNSLSKWATEGDTTVYALWVKALKYAMRADKRGYAVSSVEVENVDKINFVHIPEQFGDGSAESPILPILDVNTFSTCTQLIEIDIPNTVSSMTAANTFSGCAILEKVNMYKSSLLGYGNPSFESDDGVLIRNELTGGRELIYYPIAKPGTYEIPEGVTSIGAATFAGNRKLSAITIPTSVTFINKNAFQNCIGLTKVNFTSGEGKALSIGAGVFEGCSLLTSIKFPKRIADLNESGNGGVGGIFLYSGLRSINIEDGSSVYGSVDGVLTTKDKATTRYCPLGRVGDFKAPTEVLHIGKRSFAGCNKLTAIELHKNVGSIDERAFEGCTSLTSVTVEADSNMITIDDYAFSGCTILKTFTFSGACTLNYLGEYAFNGCRALDSFFVPKSVKTIKKGTFINCNLKEINIEQGSILESIGESAFYGASITTLRIPASVKRLDRYLFSLEQEHFANTPANNYLREVEVEEGSEITDIADYAFYKCTNLTKFNFENLPKLKTIGVYAFGQSNLTGKIVFSDSVTTIGENAFLSDSGIMSVTLGRNCMSIGTSAFSNCYKLVEVYNLSLTLTITNNRTNGMIGYYTKDIYTSANSESKLFKTDDDFWLYRGDTLSLLGYGGLSNDVILPEDIDGESYEVYNYAFYNCKAITSIVIQKGISYGDYAFTGITELKTVYFTGSSSDWNSDYSNIIPATIQFKCYYYAQTNPGSGNYWHYVDGVPTIW